MTFFHFFYKPLTSKWIVSSKNGSLVSYLIADFFFFTNRPVWLKKNNFTYGSEKFINWITEPNEFSVFNIFLLNWDWCALRQLVFLVIFQSVIFVLITQQSKKTSNTLRDIYKLRNKICIIIFFKKFLLVLKSDNRMRCTWYFDL